MWRVEAKSPFLRGVFYLQEEVEGQRNVHEHFWDPFLKGQAAVHPTAKGGWLCFHSPPCVPTCLAAHTYTSDEPAPACWAQHLLGGERERKEQPPWPESSWEPGLSALGQLRRSRQNTRGGFPGRALSLRVGAWLQGAPRGAGARHHHSCVRCRWLVA